MSKLARDNRNRDLATIHIARAQLGMDEATYRTMLRAQTGVDSASDLDHAGRKKVIQYLERQGFKRAKPQGDRPGRALAASPQMRKCRAIWLMLHNLGVVHDPSEAALAAYGRRQTGVDALQWHRRPDVLVEALKAWAMRHLPAVVEANLRQLDAASMSPERLRDLGGAVQRLRAAQANGNAALFDQYQAVWEALQP